MKYFQVVFVLLALSLVAEKKLEGNTPVVFRLDDFWASNNEDRFFVEQSIIEIHEKHKAPLVICVTPMRIAYNRTEGNIIRGLKEDEKRINLLKQSIQSGVVEIALHGNSHACLTKKSDWESAGLFRNDKSEFRGVPKDQQDRMIFESKSNLEELLEIPVRIFVPPWSSYDRNTLEVLEKYNFEIFSPWYLGESHPDDSQMTFIDCWLDPLPKKLEYVFKSTESEENYPPIIIAVHPFDISESDDPRAVISLSEYDNFVKQVVNSPNLDCVSFQALATNTTALKKLNFNRIAKIHDDLQLYHYIDRVGKYIPGAIAPLSKNILSFLGNITGFHWLIPAIYLLAALAGYAFLLLLRLLFIRFNRVWMVLSCMLFLTCVIILFKDQNAVTYLSKSSVPLVFAFGFGVFLGGCTAPFWKIFAKKHNGSPANSS